MCKINSLFELVITSLLRNNCVPVRNKSLLFLILNQPLTVRAILFIVTESYLYLRQVASLREYRHFTGIAEVMVQIPYGPEFF